MPTFEAIYRDIPEQGADQAYRAPKPKIMQEYVACMEAAYEQTGLDPFDQDGEQCPGLICGADEFRISNRSPYRDSALRIQALATGQNGAYIAHSSLVVIFERFIEADFQAAGPDDTAPGRFEMTRRSWRTLIDFVMQHADNNAFTPVDTLPLGVVLGRRGMKPIGPRALAKKTYRN